MRGFPANWIFSSLTSYFTEPWCMALFHDRFIDLRKELRQILTSKKVRVINGYVGCSLQIINHLHCWSFRLFPTFPLYGFTFKTTCTSCKQTTVYVNMMVIFREHGLFKSFYEGQISFSFSQIIVFSSSADSVGWKLEVSYIYQVVRLVLTARPLMPQIPTASQNVICNSLLPHRKHPFLYYLPIKPPCQIPLDPSSEPLCERFA